MSPQAKTRLNLGALASAIIVFAGALWGSGSKVVTLADARYVRSDSFAVHHAVDSLNAAAQFLAIRSMLAGLDSSDRCRRNQTTYCR